MTQNHNTLMEVLQRLMQKKDQVGSPNVLDASSHIFTQEALAKNQDIKKEINNYEAEIIRLNKMV